MSQQELLSKLIHQAYVKGDEFVESTFKNNLPLKDEEYRKILSLVEDWGVETSWWEIDHTIYGGKINRRK